MVFRGIKDSALALGLKAYLNERFGDFGQIEECEIDTEERRLQLRVLLRGESVAVMAAIDQYELMRVDEEVYVNLQLFSSSREWISLLLMRLLGGKRYKIPAAVAALL